MRALLVDRLGFERFETFTGCETWVVPRRFQAGQSTFARFGPATRGGEEVIEYHETDDMAEELAQAHRMTEHLRREVARLKARVSHLEQENGALALELRRGAP